MALHKSLTTALIHEFLQKLSREIDQPTTLFLLGGSALLLLGNERSTLDIDYVGDDIAVSSNPLQQLIHSIADTMQINLEAVPIDRFIPLPSNSDKRHRFFVRYNDLDVYVFDPLSIALSKLDRGFETDLEDIVYLIQHDFVSLKQLVQCGANRSRVVISSEGCFEREIFALRGKISPRNSPRRNDKPYTHLCRSVLEQAMVDALPFAQTYDLSPKAMSEHLAAVRMLLQRRA